jgi:hypothetical protein
MPEALYSLVYMSKSAIRFTQRELTDLLTQSRKDNRALQITGLLLYADGNFMQLLEGARKDVEALITRIKRDVRHRDVQVLEEGPITSRHFSEWSMAFLDFASPQVRALPGYSTFLESPFSPEDDVAQMSQRNVRLLHYFKSVMTATDATVLKLAETIEPRKEACPGHDSGA